jgi:hypothetical protein
MLFFQYIDVAWEITRYKTKKQLLLDLIPFYPGFKKLFTNTMKEIEHLKNLK